LHPMACRPINDFHILVLSLYRFTQLCTLPALPAAGIQ
jgi:hypothetical protein